MAAPAEQLPKCTRHLAVHANHVVALNDLDHGLATGDVLGPLSVALDADTWWARLVASERAGVTEMVYQPTGPDIERELRAFAAVAGL